MRLKEKSGRKCVLIFGVLFLCVFQLGFGISKMLQLDDVYAFGLLAMSTSPGGGGSNTWAYLLGGDLDLSITMTFFSTLFSLRKLFTTLSACFSLRSHLDGHKLGVKGQEVEETMRDCNLWVLRMTWPLSYLI